MVVVPNILRELKARVVDYHQKVKWGVFCLIFCFTIGAWLDINGLWCELPIMVNQLPEGWKLPSILSTSTQIAQIGPCIFLIGHHFLPKVFTLVNAIYVVLGIGAISCFLLAFFWETTGYIFGEEHSVGLILLNFSLAILDGTSSVTFMPYIGLNFAKEYLIPNYIGESLAALVPSVLSLIQGLGQNPDCYNYTNPDTNITELVQKPIIPTYSVQVYFFFMFGLLCISTTAFSFINFSPFVIRHRKKSSLPNTPTSLSNEDVKKAAAESKPFPTSDSIPPSSPSYQVINDSQMPLNQSPSTEMYVAVSNGFKEKFILLSYTFFLSFFCYGVLPGLQSYSTLPYGNDVFNLAVNLSFVVLPISIILSIWSYEVSVIQISVEFFLATALSGYIVVLSALSPCPPLLGSWLGPTLSVGSWVLVQSMYMRVRCLIATRLQRFGHKTLLILGFLTMIGQIFGGLIVFVIVNIYGLLKDKPSCVFDYSYCT